MWSPLLARLIVLSLVSVSITHADGTPTTIPLPIPHLTETTLLQVSRSVQGGPLSESLTCDLATNRALAQLQVRIQRELLIQRITSHELATAVPPKTIRKWDATRYYCQVTVRMEIPVVPRPIVRFPTTDITQGFALHVGRHQTDTPSSHVAHP